MMANDSASQPIRAQVSHVAVVVKQTDLDIFAMRAEDIPDTGRWIVEDIAFTLTHTNFCFIDAVQDDQGVAALRLFLLGDLTVPARFTNVSKLDVDSDTSLFIWLKPNRVPITDDTYVSIQDLGERLYQNALGEWLMIFAADSLFALGLGRTLANKF